MSTATLNASNRYRNANGALIIGRPGVSLETARFAESDASKVESGRRFEVQVGEALNSFAPAGTVVIHDLRVPGRKANIDHVYVFGRTAVLLDAKRWAGGVYFGTSRKAWRYSGGFSDASHTSKQTMQMALDRIRADVRLPKLTTLTAALILAAGRDGKIPNTMLLGVPGVSRGRRWSIAELQAYTSSHSKPANGALVEALAALSYRTRP